MLNSFKWKNVRCKIFVGKPKRKVQRKCNSEKWKEKRGKRVFRNSTLDRCVKVLATTILSKQNKNKKVPALDQMCTDFPLSGQLSAYTNSCTYAWMCAYISIQENKQHLHGYKFYQKSEKIVFTTPNNCICVHICMCAQRWLMVSGQNKGLLTKTIYMLLWQLNCKRDSHAHTHTHTRQLNSKGAWITWGEVLTLTYQSPTAQVIGLTGTFSENAHTCSHSHAHTQTQQGA